MVETREKILQLLRMKGPVIPAQISKEINTNILMASAYLSELSANNLVKISNLKIGGSPLYYLPGHEHKLQEFSKNLHEKERKTYEILKQKQVLRDSALDLLSRVTLQNIKDFAVPLKVDYEGKSEIFWKWYLLSNKEAEVFIKDFLSQKKKEETPEIKKETQKKIQETKAKEQPIKKEIKEVTEEKKSQVEKQVIEKPIEDKFFDNIQKYFDKSNIIVADKKLIKKNSEIEMVVEIPSPVGNLKYFCKAKNKKKITDGDLNSIFIQAQSKKMPALLLTTGQLTKKASEMLENEFKGLKVKQI